MSEQIMAIYGQIYSNNPDSPYIVDVPDIYDSDRGQTLNETLAEKVDKEDGKGLSTNDYTTTEKTKLAGIAVHAEVNQNAFSTVKVGSTNIQADTKTDTLTLVEGSNITLTPNATNDSITISANGGDGTVDAYTKSQSDSRYVQQESGKGLSSNDYTDEHMEWVENVGNKVYAPGKDSGMGKLYLKRNKSLSSQMTQANTTYVVQDDLKVGGGSVLLNSAESMTVSGVTYFYAEVILANGEQLSVGNGVKIFVQNSGYQWIDQGTSYTSTQNNQVTRVAVIAYTDTKIDYTIAGETSVTIPANCVLEFDGGSISGGTLVFTDTLIEGNAEFDAVSFSGTIKNDMFDVTWISGGDIGQKINAAQTNFKSIFVPSGNYTMTTPVVLESVKKLDCRATIEYAGALKNCEGVFLVHGSTAGEIDFNEMFPSSNVSIDYSANRTVNCVGLEIRSCNRCSVNVKRIVDFNENVRISDLEGAGGCYNQFLLQDIRNGNANVRLYQHRISASSGRVISWVNENTFNGGSFRHDSATLSRYNTYYDFVMGGPALDLPSYMPNPPRDDYDYVNAIIIQNANMETINSVAPVLARNARFKLINCRDEGNGYAAKLIGDLSDLDYESKYKGVDNFLLSDVSECEHIHFANPSKLFGKQTVVSLLNSLKTYDGKNVAHGMSLATSSGITSDLRNDYGTYKGVVVDTTTYKMFHVRRSVSGRLYIMYLDANGVNVSASYSNDKPDKWMILNSNNIFTDQSDKTEESIRVPTAITKVFVGVSAGENLESLNILTSSNQDVSIPRLSIRGATSGRPIGLPLDVPYFDTDFNIPVYWNGSGWVNSQGKIPSSEGPVTYTAEVPIVMGSEPSALAPNNAYGSVCYSDDSNVNMLTIISWVRKSIGVVIDTTVCKTFRVKIEDTNGNDLSISMGGYAYIKYLTSDGKSLVQDMGSYPAPNEVNDYRSDMNAWAYASYYKGVTVPNSVTKAFIGVFCSDPTSVITKITISSQDDEIVVLNIVPTVGTTSERPPFTKIEDGYQFFDTTLGKPIWGVNNDWVDSTGTSV